MLRLISDKPVYLIEKKHSHYSEKMETKSIA